MDREVAITEAPMVKPRSKTGAYLIMELLKLNVQNVMNMCKWEQKVLNNFPIFINFRLNH